MEDYLTHTLVADYQVLGAALEANAAAGLPPHDVAPNQGKLLMLLVRLARARTVLEIGTLGGYSTIWLARGMPADGHLVTLEAEPGHARVARSNLARAALPQRVDLHGGPALETLPSLVDSDAAPFDVVFIDADKPNNARYLDWALRLSRPGTLIVADNVVRDGHVTESDSDDDRVVGVRSFLELLGFDPRVEATAVQTVGSKGWDGFALAIVSAADLP